MVGDWNGLIVTSACPIPGPLIEALLRAGVKAVVAPEHKGHWALEMRRGSRSAIKSLGTTIEADGGREGSALREASQEAVMSFFAAFYEALFSGAEVMGAIQAGETAVPETSGLFRFHV